MTTGPVAFLGCVFMVTAGQVIAQTPVIAPGGIVNGARFAPGPVAPGSIASIFGSNLASTLASASTIPLSTALVQINIHIPFDVLPNGAASGNVDVTVKRTTAGSSQPASIQIAPGRLQANGHAIAVNNVDGTLVLRRSIPTKYR